MLLVAMALAAQRLPAASVDACTERPFGWSCQELWIEALPENERNVVLLSLSGRLNLEVENRLLPQVKSMKDACWVVSVQGFGKELLAYAAKENSPQWIYFYRSFSVYLRMSEGALSFREGDILLKSLVFPGEVAGLATEFVSTEQKYKTRLDKAETVLIALSKMMASKHQKDGVSGDRHTPFKGCRTD